MFNVELLFQMSFIETDSLTVLPMMKEKKKRVNFHGELVVFFLSLFALHFGLCAGGFLVVNCTVFYDLA